MEIKSSEARSEYKQVAAYIVADGESGDEVSLADLWRMLAKRKAIILLSLCLAFGLSIAYLMIVQPKYRATAFLLPPQEQDVQQLFIEQLFAENLSPEDADESVRIEPFSPERVFKEFLIDLRSPGLRREFFNKNKLGSYFVEGENVSVSDLDRAFDTSFNKNLTVEVERGDTSFVSVSFVFADPELAAQWLNEFIGFANSRTVSRIHASVKSVVDREIEKTRSLLNIKLQYEAQRRADRIAVLQEALHIAQTLGIDNASTLPVMSGAANAGVEVNTAESPLYARGARALEAEIAVLEKRKSDEPFVKGLRDLQENKATLQAISIDPQKLSAVTFESPARTPYQVESPRRGKVLLIAGLLGLFTGMIMVFTAEFFSKVYAKQE